MEKHGVDPAENEPSEVSRIWEGPEWQCQGAYLGQRRTRAARALIVDQAASRIEPLADNFLCTWIVTGRHTIFTTIKAIEREPRDLICLKVRTLASFEALTALTNLPIRVTCTPEVVPLRKVAACLDLTTTILCQTSALCNCTSACCALVERFDAVKFGIFQRT